MNADELQEHPLIRELVDDVSAPPSIVLLNGLLGASSRRGYLRLYLDDELRSWVDIPQVVIRSMQRFPPSESRPAGKDAVWVDLAGLLEGLPVRPGGAHQDRPAITDADDLREFAEVAATPGSDTPGSTQAVRHDAPGEGGPCGVPERGTRC